MNLLNYALLMLGNARVTVFTILVVIGATSFAAADDWPALPNENGKVIVPAQEWPLRPGPRSVPIEIFYPGGRRSNIDSQTGIFLTLHNWDGVGAQGTADPAVLADRYNVIAITVDYLQSGPSKTWKEPYDFGYLQALDALRALYVVYHGLEIDQVPFDRQRIFAVGGSGGGNVALMCNKLAPRTFACVVSLSGMAKLSDDMAFNLPGGSSLNAQYSRDSKNPAYLSADAQQLRFIGYPEHLQTMHLLGNTCKVIVVHGMEDTTCPVEDAQELVDNLKGAKLNVDSHFVAQSLVDGKLYRNANHSLGNRTQILQHVADDYLSPKSPRTLHRAVKSDYDLRDELVRYRTHNGQFVISYQQGYPIGRFEVARRFGKSDLRRRD